MLKRIREQTGTAGLALAVIALVLALVGGAYAASGGLTGKQKKEVTKIAKKYAGKPGEKGATGATGPQGLKGDTGAQGVEGKEGKKGENGENGEDGLEGPEGSPWTDNGTLPPGATETGTWAFSRADAESELEGVLVPLSFSIPFPYSLKKAAVHFGQAEEGGAFSSGGACPSELLSEPFEPEAKPGQLCIYKEELTGLVGATNPVIVGAPYVSGPVLAFPAIPEGSTAASGYGTFAVTGCTEKVVGGIGQRECEEG